MSSSSSSENETEQQQQPAVAEVEPAAAAPAAAVAAEAPASVADEKAKKKRKAPEPKPKAEEPKEKKKAAKKKAKKEEAEEEEEEDDEKEEEAVKVKVEGGAARTWRKSPGESRSSFTYKNLPSDEEAARKEVHKRKDSRRKRERRLRNQLDSGEQMIPLATFRRMMKEVRRTSPYRDAAGNPDLRVHYTRRSSERFRDAAERMLLCTLQRGYIQAVRTQSKTLMPRHLTAVANDWLGSVVNTKRADAETVYAV